MKTQRGMECWASTQLKRQSCQFHEPVSLYPQGSSVENTHIFTGWVDTRGTECGQKESCQRKFLRTLSGIEPGTSPLVAQYFNTAPTLAPNDHYSQYRRTDTPIYTATCDKMSDTIRNYGEKPKEAHGDESDRSTTEEQNLLLHVSVLQLCLHLSSLRFKWCFQNDPL